MSFTKMSKIRGEFFKKNGILVTTCYDTLGQKMTNVRKFLECAILNQEAKKGKM